MKPSSAKQLAGTICRKVNSKRQGQTSRNVVVNLYDFGDELPVKQAATTHEQQLKPLLQRSTNSTASGSKKRGKQPALSQKKVANDAKMVLSWLIDS
jgi:hypothetical protein